MEENKKLVAVIDVTPTWAGVLPIYLNVLREHYRKPSKSSIIAVDNAERALNKMAAVADQYIRLNKDFDEMESQANDAIATLLGLIDNPVKALIPANKKILDAIRKLVKEYKDAKETAGSGNQGMVSPES